MRFDLFRPLHAGVPQHHLYDLEPFPAERPLQRGFIDEAGSRLVMQDRVAQRLVLIVLHAAHGKLTHFTNAYPIRQRPGRVGCRRNKTERLTRSNG